jgi:hypothetical protein
MLTFSTIPVKILGLEEWRAPMSLLRDVVRKLSLSQTMRDVRVSAPVSGGSELYFTTQGEMETDRDLELLRSLCR